MSTPIPGRAKYNVPVRNTWKVRAPATVWSSLLKRQICKQNRADTFRRLQPSCTVVEVVPNQAVALRSGCVYVGRRMPFEMALQNTTLRIDCHSSAVAELQLTIYFDGGVAVDCSRGGSVELLSGNAWLLALCRPRRCVVLRKPSDVSLLTLSEFVCPGKYVVAATAEVGLVAVFHVGIGQKYLCPTCGFATESLSELGRHFKVKRWIGLPRPVTERGLGQPLTLHRKRLGRRDGWRERFVNESINGTAVAWHHLPRLDSDSVRVRC